MSRVPRVGGGYAHNHATHAYKYTSPQRAENDVMHMKEARHKMIRTFDGHGVTAIVTVQGGSVLWTAEGSGELLMRNPETGDTSSSVTRSKKDARINCMEEIESCIFAGCDDGGLEVYDHYLGEELVRRNEHSHAIVAVAELPRGGTSVYAVSLSADKVCAWCLPPTDELTLELSSECVFAEYTDSSPESLATSPDGNYIYIGFADGTISRLAGKNLEVEGQWHAHRSASVSALCHTGACLFSGGSDGNVRTWDTEVSQGCGILVYDGEMHNMPIRKIVCEKSPDLLPLKQQVIVSIADNGMVRWQWDGRRPQPLSADEESGILGYTGYNLWDGMRAWTFSSNGRALPWFSTRHKSNDLKRDAEYQLNAVIKHENEEIERWTQRVDLQKEKTTRLGAKTCVYYLENDIQLYGMALLYFRKLQHYRRMRVIQRKALVFLDFCQPRAKLNALRVYYRRLWLCWRAGKTRRARYAAMRYIVAGCQAGLRRLYWQKLQGYLRRQAARKNARRACEHLAYQTTTFQLASRYRSWTLFHARSVQYRISSSYADRLGTQNTHSLLHRYYYQLWRHASDVRETRALGNRAVVLESGAAVPILTRYYARLQHFSILRRRRRALLTARAAVMSRVHAGRICYPYFMAWREKVHVKKSEDWRRKMGGVKKQIDYLEGQTANKYTDLFEQIDRLKEEVEAKRKRKAELESQRDLMQQHIQFMQDKLDDRNRTKTVMEAYDDIMMKLKEMSINFERDRALILKVTDKAKAASAARTFLESHMEIKGMVVRNSGQSKLGTDDLWPMEKVKRKLRDHEWRQIVIAVKVMVSAYDLLTRRDIVELDTDDEIVLNGENLVDLYRTALQKKLTVR
eukprot:TRINITY_DN13594_c0_g2_i1.p1 TRINITY_DN13594_c0_g2~~TRINITY_DN13594_c0_g2_i1.p1  ORF type:complete len:857 (+),score=284.89 TRINITY_DN13594_c0_g2_i1:43-2613(+)